MAKVVIAFDAADPARQGSTVDVSEQEAQIMVKEGRARYASTNAGKPRRKPSKPEPVEGDAAS